MAWKENQLVPTSIISFIQSQIDSLENELYIRRTSSKDFKKDAQLINPSIAERT